MAGQIEYPSFRGVSACYEGATTLVLGASGFIGRWVARLLSLSGARNYLVVREPGTAADVFDRYGVIGELVNLDLENHGSALRSLLKAIEPDIVFNLAGYGVDRRESDNCIAHRINTQLVCELCECMHGAGEKRWSGRTIVHVGSAQEYGDIGGDLAETSVPNPTTVYGRSKLAGTLALEKYCRETSTRGITARLFSVYGPGEHDDRLLPSLFAAARSRRELSLTAGAQIRDFTYIEDIAEGLLRLGVSESGPGEIINLATGRVHTVREFVATAAGILNIPRDRLSFGNRPTRSDEMTHLPVRLTRLQQVTGWTPKTGIYDGILRTKDFLKTESGENSLAE